MNKKILIVFSEFKNSELMSEHLELFDIKTEVTASFEDAYKRSSNYDLLIMDLDHALALGKNEKAELFLNSEYPVFNWIKKIKTKILLLDTYSPEYVEEKLNAIGAKNVVYHDKITLMKDLIPIIKLL